MVSKEECITTINRFLKNQRLDDAVILFKYLCDIKEITNRDSEINMIISNLVLMQLIIPLTIEKLEAHFNLIRVSDKSGNPIIVF